MEAGSRRQHWCGCRRKMFILNTPGHILRAIVDDDS
jgi:hypothetical protein